MTNLDFHLESFMLYCTSKNLSKKTLASYEQTLKLFLMYLKEHFKIVDASKVQTAHIRHYIKYVKERGKYTVVSREGAKQVNYPDHRTDFNKPVSMTTIANYVRNIKVFFNYLYKIEREIPKNPIENLENPKTERKMKKTITAEEFKKVLDSFDLTTFHAYRNFIITKLLLDTGMRVSECINLTPEVVDFNHKSILITKPKYNHERYVYFSFKLAREIKQWMTFKDRYNNSPYLFPTNRGTPLEIRNYEKALRGAGRSVGVNIHPHQLRNNFAKYYILNGGDWFSLCRILGHSSVDVTQKAYLDFTDEEIGKKYQKHSPLAFMDGL